MSPQRSCFFFAAPVFGALIETNGALDSTFDPGRITNGQVNACFLQADGKLVIAGQFAKVNGITRGNIARLNPDGSLDASFAAGAGTNGSISSIVAQPDGKFVITGFFSTYDGVSRLSGAARLNADGSLDASFDPGAVLGEDATENPSAPGTPLHPGAVASATLQPDNKIVVTGYFYRAFTGPATSVSRSGIARFNADGSFDPTFDPGTGLVLTSSPGSEQGSFIVAQSDGRLVVEGNFNQYNGNSTPAGFAHIEADGAYNASFSVGVGASWTNVAGLFVQPDDHIVVYGNFTLFNGVARNGIVRLDKTTGAVDAGFSTPPFSDYADIGTIQGMTRQADGKFVVFGAFHTFDGVASNGMARLETTGARDLSFNATDGVGPNGYTFCGAVRPSDGHIFVGGYFSTFGAGPAKRNNIALATATGLIDTAFAPPDGCTDGLPQVLVITVQGDGKVIVGGIFTSVQNEPHYNFVRLNPNGTIDPTFNVTAGTSRSVRALVVQPDNQILIAGQFGGINGVPAGRVARLNPDGTIDGTFNAGTGADNIIYAMARDAATGAVYLGGDFFNVNGTARTRLAKLSSAGVLDATFDPGTGPSSTVRAVTAPNGSAGPGHRRKFHLLCRNFRSSDRPS